ncbi:MAG: hypothetical protein K2N11_03625, partial [Mucispirillum sp.]|nr:hypothetical protein [Mucispirillum sp.]
MQFNLSSSIDWMTDNAQTYVTRNIKNNPEIYQNVVEKKAFTKGINMDSFQKSSMALNDARLSISNTYGFLGYNTLNLSGISNAIKDVMMEYKLENQKNAEAEGYTPIDELFAEYSEISDEFIISTLQLAETVEKPKDAQDMDDLRWGMLINLGKEIGMNDKDGLMEITQQDLKIYYDLKHHNTQEAFDKLGEYDQNGNIVKRYENPEDVWKDIFLTDSNGNFLKDKAGKLIRNKDFTYTTSVQVDDNVKFRDLHWKSYDNDNNDTIKVAHYGSGELMCITASVIDGNDGAFSWIANFTKSMVPAHKMQHEQDVQYAKNDAEKLFIYKKSLVNDYFFFLDNVKALSPDLSYKGQKKIYENKLDNSKWVTFKPYQQGSFINEANKIRNEDYKY